MNTWNLANTMLASAALLFTGLNFWVNNQNRLDRKKSEFQGHKNKLITSISLTLFRLNSIVANIQLACIEINKLPDGDLKNLMNQKLSGMLQKMQKSIENGEETLTIIQRFPLLSVHVGGEHTIQENNGWNEAAKMLADEYEKSMASLLNDIREHVAKKS